MLSPVISLAEKFNVKVFGVMLVVVGAVTIIGGAAAGFSAETFTSVWARMFIGNMAAATTKPSKIALIRDRMEENIFEDPPRFRERTTGVIHNDDNR